MATTVIKLGSSIVVGESGELRMDVLAGVCDEISSLHGAGGDVVVVTSGAIGHGMRILELAVRPRAIDELQAASAVGQGRLYRVYEELLAERALRSAQVLLTFFDMSARTHYLNARHTLRRLLSWRIVPVINENDTTTTDEISFGDNDFLAAQVAVLLDAQRLLLLTDIAGLHTADPRSDPSAELVKEVEDFSSLEQMEITAGTSPLGSGGMRSKVVAAEMATAAGVEAIICDGTQPSTIAAAAAGEPAGTLFRARSGRHSSFKLWLKYAKPTQGTITIDAGAARALTDGGTSLLPVGIVDVRGEWHAGDAVEVSQDGRVLGKGICNYSAGELRRIKGMKSSAIRELLPRATEEAVHRDYFVLS